MMDSDTAMAAAALRVFRAANLRAPYGWAQDDAERLWSTALARYTLTSVMLAAGDWVVTATEFPTLSEFVTCVEYQERKLHQPAPIEYEAGACPECGHSAENPSGWVLLSDPKVHPTDTVRPCSQCQPTSWALWNAGHYKPHLTGCSCGHELCRDRRKR